MAGDGEDIEEVVVTGSYLKRSAANSPSPLSVVTQADIEDAVPSATKELLEQQKKDREITTDV